MDLDFLDILSSAGVSNTPVKDTGKPISEVEITEMGLGKTPQSLSPEISQCVKCNRPLGHETKTMGFTTCHEHRVNDPKSASFVYENAAPDAGRVGESVYLDETTATTKPLTVTIPPIAHVVEASAFLASQCQHLCECGNAWTHGDKAKCRYPDIRKQGSCPTCVESGKPNVWAGPDADVESDGKGGLKIAAKLDIEVRNKQRILVKDMTSEQLTSHIAALAKEIEVLRIRSMETRKVRSDVEESELEKIPPHEREEFRQQLRRGKAAKVKKGPKEKKVSAKEREAQLATSIKPVTAGGDAKLIASWMVKTGKSQAQVEAFLYD